MTDYILASLYLAAWILTLLWYQHRNRQIDAGTAIIASYIGYGIFSLLTLADDFFIYDELRLFPYIYLYVMLMIALTPTIYHHLSPPERIEPPRTRVLIVPCIIIILCGLLQLPGLVSNFSEGIVGLFLNADAGQEAYSEHIEEVRDAGSTINNLTAVLFNMVFDCGVFLTFYLLTLKKKNPLFITAMIIAMFIGMVIPVTKGQRGSVITCALTVVVGYLLFRRYMAPRINKVVQTVSAVAAIIIALPIGAITVSRFGERDGNIGVGGFINWYIGQGSIYFNNSVLNAGGIRYGDRTFNLFKRLIDPDTPKNYNERRAKYTKLEIDDYYFTTFVGDFVLDFGPVAAVVIFIVFNLYILTVIRPRDGTIKLHQLLAVYFTMCICMQGGMTLFMYSDGMNLKMVVFFLLYVYLRYHDVLLQKFPLKKYEENR